MNVTVEQLTTEYVAEEIAPLFSMHLSSCRRREETYLANHSLGRPLDRTAEDVHHCLALWYARMDWSWYDDDGWLAEMDAAGVDRTSLADALLRELPRAQEAIARRILLRLISLGEGRADTRRQQPWSKLRAANDDSADFDIVLRRLIADRLLTADEDHHGGEARTDLAHEAMIAAWPTLAGWIETHRGEEQHRRQLEAAAGAWVKRGRGAGRARGSPLSFPTASTWPPTTATGSRCTST